MKVIKEKTTVCSERASREYHDEPARPEKHPTQRVVEQSSSNCEGTTMIDKLKDAMRQVRITPPANIETDGEFHWFHVDGDRCNPPTGWYLAYTKPWIASFGCSECGLTRSWIQKGYHPPDNNTLDFWHWCEEHYNPAFLHEEPPCEPPCVALYGICEWNTEG